MRYVVFFRGINVGKANRIKISDIASMMGRHFGSVISHGQSGNFLFDSDMKKEEIVPLIGSSFSKEFGFEAACIIRSTEELRKAADGNPFPEAAGDRMFFTFMSGESSSQKTGEWERGGDIAKLAFDVVYLRCEGEYHKTKLSNNFFEKELGVVCTTRNRNVVEAVLKK